MHLFGQATVIMLVGMALVFVFLAIMIQCVVLAARIVHRIEGEPCEEEPDPAAEGLPDRRRIAAIAAALHGRGS